MSGKETSKLSMLSKVDDLFAKASFGNVKSKDDQIYKEDELIDFDTVG